MDSDLYAAITLGSIDHLKQIASSDDVLLHQMTPLHNTALHIAVKSNQILCVIEICNMCPSLLTQANSKGDTPLHLAARLGLSDIASFLIHRAKIHQADIESRGSVVEILPVEQQRLVRMRNKENDTALHEAVRNNRFEVVKLLTELDPTFEYSECNNAGETPLYLAAEDGLLDCVVQILETCQTSAHDGPHGRTALHIAVISHDNSDIIKILLEKKQGITNEADEYGCTPLHYATYFGKVPMVVQLLEVDPLVAYMTDKDGKSALHVAASMTKRTDVIEEITRRCPHSWEILDNKGQTFLHIAAQKGEYKLIECATRQENMMVEDLLNQPDNCGNTPFHLACMFRNFHTARILCRDNRVNKSIVNKDKLMALDLLHDSMVSAPFSIFVLEFYNELKKDSPKRSWRKQIIKDVYKPDKIRLGTGTEQAALEKARHTRVWVAALIATVTFQAGFTIPGGYNSDGTDKGMAVLTRKPAFIAFLVCDSVAMILSMFTVFIHFWTYPEGLAIPKENMYHFTSFLEYRCTYFSMIAMVAAFITGTYSVLLHSPSLVISICILDCSFFLLCILLFYKAYKMNGFSFRYFSLPPPTKK